MQAMESIFTGEQGVAYIPMPKGRGFTPRLVKGIKECLNDSPAAAEYNWRIKQSICEKSFFCFWEKDDVFPSERKSSQ